MVKRLFKAVAFQIGFLACLFFIQAIFVVRWDYPIMIQYHTSKAEEYDRLKRNSVQAIFLGTSHVQFSVIPMQLYEENHIVTYNASLGGERISTIYYQLKNLLEKQKPDCVLLDVSPLFFSSFSGEGWSYLLDSGYPYNLNRWEASLQCAREYKETQSSERFESAFIEHFFPLTAYKTRWKQLSETDFELGSGLNYSGKGYEVTEITQPGLGSLDEISEREKELSSEDLSYKSVLDMNLVWLYKIKDYCDKQGVNLVLMKIPVFGDPTTYASAWTYSKSEVVHKVADQLQVIFIDLMYDVNAGIDPEKDFCDNGAHMNYRGAVKVTRFLGDFLKREMMLVNKHDDYYDASMQTYGRLKAAAELGEEESWEEYFKKLILEVKGKTILMSMIGEKNHLFTQSEQASLTKLGIEYDKYLGEKSFIAVIENGKVIVDEKNDEVISRMVETSQGRKIILNSAGAEKEATTSMQGGDIVYADDQEGLHIVVIDDSLDIVLDSVCFSKPEIEEDPICSRDTLVTSGYIQQYEYKMYKR